MQKNNQKKDKMVNICNSDNNGIATAIDIEAKIF